jgi:hypothetical protein
LEFVALGLGYVDPGSASERMELRDIRAVTIAYDVRSRIWRENGGMLSVFDMSDVRSSFCLEVQQELGVDEDRDSTFNYRMVLAFADGILFRCVGACGFDLYTAFVEEVWGAALVNRVYRFIFPPVRISADQCRSVQISAH